MLSTEGLPLTRDPPIPEPHRHRPFFYAEDLTRVRLTGADARHLAVVRRAAVGDLVTVCDGQGSVVEARLTSVSPAAVEASAEPAALARPARPRPVLRVLQGLAQGAKVDGVVRDLVEIGVDEVAVFGAGRSVPRWDDRQSAAAAQRWQAVALEAAKQSRRRWLPVLAGPQSLASAAAGTGGGLGLIAHPGADQRLREVLAAAGSTAPERVWLVVGPEGGLTGAEVDAFTAAGGVPVALGEQILRTETAGVSIASIILYFFDRLG